MDSLIVKNYPKSSATEAIKSVRTNLRFSAVNKKIKTILITSSMAGEGKSFNASNLALAFAESKEKVLLIDCDLRRGHQKDTFGLKGKNKYGLSNLLINENWEDELFNYIELTDIKNLNLITRGPIPPNPTVLLESKRFEKIIDKLKSVYDVIILDAPPVNGLTDALVLTKISDVVLLIARARKTSIDMLEDTKEALETVNANIAGVVLNCIDKKDTKYYKNYYYYSRD